MSIDIGPLLIDDKDYDRTIRNSIICYVNTRESIIKIKSFLSNPKVQLGLTLLL